ncbi:glycosyltransferase [Posidoniimonas corsicana]|nr:nucleotide disphospho-sugar-binding domain-containing protein [Posidoniimonas corsicana]
MLRDRGHSVFLAVKDKLKAKDIIGDDGFTYLQPPARSRTLERYKERPATFAEVLARVGFGNAEYLWMITCRWRELFAEVATDAGVFDYSPFALLASCGAGFPRATLGTGYFSPPPNAQLPSFLLPTAEAVRESAKAGSVVVANVNSVLDRNNQDPIACIGDLHQRADRQFLLTFKELDHFARPNGDYYGMWSPAGGAPPSWPAGDGPRVFAYLKPTDLFPLLTPVLAAFCKMGLRLAVYGVDGDPALQRVESEYLWAAPARLDLDRVADECDFAVLHGNNGSLTHLLRRGVPLLILPMTTEQAVIGCRIAELGAGIVANPRSPVGLINAVKSLVRKPSYRQAARAFQEKYSGYDAAASAYRVAEHIERLAAN